LSSFSSSSGLVNKLNTIVEKSELSVLADELLTATDDEIRNEEIRNSFASKVMTAYSALSEDDSEIALAVLQDLILQIEDQRGKEISSGEADILIELVENAKESIDGSSCIGYANGIPKFVTIDYIERNKIQKISKFRSSVGHDFSDNFESCRSMKHYVVPFETYYSNLEIFAPVDGNISYMKEEWAGTQIGIKSKDYPDYTFVIFHVNINNLNVGDEVYAGQKIGNHIGRLTDSDIAVWVNAPTVNTPNGIKWVSYFDVMTDCLFQEYQKYGLTSRDEVIIQKDARDADPLICDGERFTDTGNLENWIFLTDTTLPKLISSNPADGEINVPFTQRTISYTFNKPMRPDKGVTWWGLDVSSGYQSYWSSDQKTIYFTFYENFPINTTVSWILNPSIANNAGELGGFSDLYGNLLPIDTYFGSFNTSNNADTTSSP